MRIPVLGVPRGGQSQVGLRPRMAQVSQDARGGAGLAPQPAFSLWTGEGRQPGPILLPASPSQPPTGLISLEASLSPVWISCLQGGH